VDVVADTVTIFVVDGGYLAVLGTKLSTAPPKGFGHSEAEALRYLADSIETENAHHAVTGE
jgi:hypothetical protein